MDFDKTLTIFNYQPTPNTHQLSLKIRTFAPMNIKEIENKRIAVLLSGGVDSSVVVYEFARMGLHPDCGGMGLLIRGGPRNGYGCIAQVWLQVGGDRLPQGVLGPGN